MANTMVEIVDTTLREAHHSLVASRLNTEELAPLAEMMDAVGYAEIEVWGGAPFDACLRYHRENPWNRLRVFSSRIKKTPLKMLVRGQYLVGYRPYPLDVQKKFIHHSRENGISIFRLADSLNDFDNLLNPIRFVKEAGAKAEVVLIYTQSPHHSPQKYIELARRAKEMGADAVGLQDDAGILTPGLAREIIEGIKKTVGLAVGLHCHSTTGMSAMTYLAAAQAGAKSIACSVGAFSQFYAQPATETLLAAFADQSIKTSINPEALKALNKKAEKIAVRHLMNKSERAMFEHTVFVHKIPIGMATTLIGQLSSYRALDRLDEVLEEIIRVRKEFGWPPLTTPLSQLVGTQAIFNVLQGKRYEVIPREVRDFFRGCYGKTPGPVDLAVEKTVLAGESKISGRPWEECEAGYDEAKAELKSKGLLESEEDVLTYVIYPRAGLNYLRYRKDPESVPPLEGIPDSMSGLDDVARMNRLAEFMEKNKLCELVVESGDEHYKLSRGVRPPLGLPVYAPPAAPVPSGVSAPSAVVEDDSRYKKIVSPMVGTFYRASSPEAAPYVSEGQSIGADSVVCIVEAMKLFNEITAGVSGKVAKVCVENEELVQAGQTLFLVE